MFRDDEVTDDQTLESISKIAGSNCFALEAHEKVHIDCKMMKGNHVKIDMETTDTVLDVKKSLTKTEHVAHDVI